MNKRLALASVVVGTLGVLALSAPAQAADACLTVKVDVVGTPISVDEQHCLPEGPALPGLPL